MVVHVCGFLELLLTREKKKYMYIFFLIYPQGLQASLADKLAAVHARQQSLDMENKFIYDDIVDVWTPRSFSFCRCQVCDSLHCHLLTVLCKKALSYIYCQPLSLVNWNLWCWSILYLEQKHWIQGVYQVTLPVSGSIALKFSLPLALQTVSYSAYFH